MLCIFSFWSCVLKLRNIYRFLLSSFLVTSFFGWHIENILVTNLCKLLHKKNVKFIVWFLWYFWKVYVNLFSFLSNIYLTVQNVVKRNRILKDEEIIWWRKLLRTQRITWLLYIIKKKFTVTVVEILKTGVKMANSKKT